MSLLAADRCGRAGAARPGAQGSRARRGRCCGVPGNARDGRRKRFRRSELRIRKPSRRSQAHQSIRGRVAHPPEPLLMAASPQPPSAQQQCFEIHSAPNLCPVGHLNSVSQWPSGCVTPRLALAFCVNNDAHQDPTVGSKTGLLVKLVPDESKCSKAGTARQSRH